MGKKRGANLLAAGATKKEKMKTSCTLNTMRLTRRRRMTKKKEKEKWIILTIENFSVALMKHKNVAGSCR